jgi:hypothetical protein
MSGSNNDINVLQCSPVFARLAEGNAPLVAYEINGHSCDKGYYIVDDIYPSGTTILKTTRNPEDEKCKRFAKEQEDARKDVEREFGLLQSRWGIVQHPARIWSTERMWEVMTSCVIIHNMIVQEERDDNIYDGDWNFEDELVEPRAGAASWKYFLHMHNSLQDRTTYNRLQADLIEHM